MPELHFEPDTHTYTLGDVRIDSVTQIMRGVGLIPPIPSYREGATIAAMERGTIVHRATELAEQDDLDEDSIDDEIYGYVQTYSEAKARMEPWTGKMKLLLMEIPLYHYRYIYAGMPDRVFYAPALDCYVLWDLKTGQPAAWHLMQVAAYQKLAELELRRCGRSNKNWKLASVYLTEKGWSIKEYGADEIAEAWGVFQSALNVHHYRKRSWR